MSVVALEKKKDIGYCFEGESATFVCLVGSTDMLYKLYSGGWNIITAF